MQIKQTLYNWRKWLKMHNIAESTLRYYDEKGIFNRPLWTHKQISRYYTIDQFSLLDTIKFLRQLNIPLKGN
ncbi:MerR family transcriptional regulator [Bacillus pacificus]